MRKKEGKEMIPQIKKILYATDLSKNASYAFFYAVDMAKRHNASIVILHSIDRIRHMYGERVEEILQETKDQERKTDIKEIKEGLQEFCTRTETQIGDPSVELVSK